ncbi:MAG: ATP-binding protein [Planctomycetes bacterium]|nr:ATP-binding protein [Planctomycetota bacterium]
MDSDEALILISTNEGQTVELKTGFAEQNAAFESLGAFANAEGGTVFLGVRPDRSIVGVDIGANTLENFSNTLRRESQPPLSPSIGSLEVDGKTIVAAEIGALQPGQLVHVFNKALVRVGRTNQVMSPEEQKARLLADQPRTDVGGGRPQFGVRITGVTRRERDFSLTIRMSQVTGERVASIEWRFRGPRFLTAWNHESASLLPHMSIVETFDLAKEPATDDLLDENQLGLEIRFSWRGDTLSEVHRWPVSRRELPKKILWDLGTALEPLQLGDPEVHLVALPPTHDNHVQLTVENGKDTQDFVVDVLEVANVEEPQQRYKLKWREDTRQSESRTIHKGSDDVLDVAQVTPPDPAPGGLTDGHRRGSFKLFSLKVPNGWEVHAGASGWIAEEEALTPSDPYHDSIALKVRVSGSAGALVTRRVIIGFSRDSGSGGSNVTVGVDDWPSSPNE